MSQYQIPASLLQDIIVLLESLPAKHSRHMLNAIESTTQEQDRAAAALAANLAQKKDKESGPIKRSVPEGPDGGQPA